MPSPHSLQCPQVLHAPRTPICGDTRMQHKALMLPSTHRAVAPAASCRTDPLDIPPLAPAPSKGRRHRQRANSFAPQHAHKSHSALGKAVFQLPLLPSTATFPSCNTSQRGNSPSPCSRPSHKEESLLGGRQRPQSPRKGEVRASRMVWELLGPEGKELWGQGVGMR